MKKFLLKELWVTFCLLSTILFQPLWGNNSPHNHYLQQREVTEILEEMSEHYQVFFSYETKLLREIKVDFTFQKTKSLAVNMNRLFQKVNLQYKTIGSKYYVIFKPSKQGKRSAKKLERKIRQIQKLETKSGMHLQQVSSKKSKQLKNITEAIIKIKKEATITGNVIDASSGEPLIGVNILVQGTSRGTVTDFNGDFSIEASSTDVLVFSYTGYNEQTITVGNQTDITVRLSTDTEILDEVVIIGYSTQRKSDLTGAVGQVSSEDIDKYTYSDASQALQGRMAGVSVQAQGGAPGADAVITIRGAGSLSDASPLFVIDGMLTSSMNSLNPSDIESISVLKDASASAVYGSRAANGVVIITTKKGSKDRLTIDLDVSTGIQKVINTFDWANAQEYAEIANRADDNDGSPRDPANDSEFNPNNTSDLYGESFQTAPIHNTNLRLAGGSENTQFGLSLNYFKQDGIVKFSDFERATARANGGFTKGRFKLESVIGLTRTINNPNPYFNKERNLLPTIRLMDDNGDWSASDIPDVPGAPTIGSFYGQGTVFNELGMAAVEDRTITRHTILGNLAASYEIINGLTYKLNLGVEFYDDNNFKFTPLHPVIQAAGNITNSELSETNKRFQSDLIEHTLNFKRVISGHSIDLLAGYTNQETNIRSLGVEARKFPSNDTRIASAAEEISIPANPPTEDLTSVIQSYFGRVNYVFNDRYLVTATIRRDGSSLFKEGLRWGTFPSAAIGWNISNEDFMSNVRGLSDIKLRASYGEIGSNNVQVYSTDPSLNLFSEYILGDSPSRVTGYSITRGVNPNITWETTKTTNIGVEFGALNNKLSVTMDYFIKNSEDVLVGLRLPLYTGFGNAIPFNTASVENKGFEFSANYGDRVGELNYNVAANFSFLDNVVTALGDATPIIQGSFTSNTINSTKTDIGQPISSFFGYVVDGIYQTDQEAADANDQAGNPKAGDFRFKDLDNDGDVDEEDRTYIGNPTPNFEYAFNFSIDYKGFDVNLFFNGVSGNDILNGTKYRGYFDFNGNKFADALNAWSPTNTGADIPRNTFADPAFNRRMSTFYLESGAYFRLRNAQVGYTLTPDFLNQIGIAKARIYVSATNLFTITDYTGYYPEVGRNARNAGAGRRIFNSGVDEGAYPVPRDFRFGLQVSF